jgi:hypothetical protein
LAILSRDEERFDHFGLNEVAVELIQLVQPKIVALKVQRRFRWVVWVPSLKPERLSASNLSLLMAKLYRSAVANCTHHHFIM